MRIGFDGKRAVQNFTGLGNYSRYVADILCHFYPENDYVLYAPKKRENKRMNLLTGQYRQLTLAYPATSFWKKLSSLWRNTPYPQTRRSQRNCHYAGRRYSREYRP